MDYYLYAGVIKQQSLETWSDNQDPFEILENRKAITNIDWITFLSDASKLFSEKVQLDWGSYAYKANKDQLRHLVERYNAKIPGLEALPDENLGVVFIEMP